MSTETPLTKRSGRPQVQIVQSDPYPRWEQLPLERQRELVLLLASLLLRRLAGQGLSKEVGSDD